MFIRKLLLATVTSCLSLAALAESVAHLHQVREPAVQGEERDALLTRALDSLVVRLTGRTDAPQTPALAALRKAPQQIVSQFGFEADGSALVVEFDPASADRALRQAGLSLWGGNRPLVLVWWLEEGVAGSSLLSDGQSASEILRRAAQHRGLPLRLPLGDLSEQLAATPEALASAELAELSDVSERYAADVMLAVRSTEVDGTWQGQWHLRFLDQVEKGRATGADPVQLADAVMLAVLQRLAEHFVAPPGAATDLELWIDGADLSRYAELERLLEPLGARLLRAEADRLVYSVKASPEQLRAQLGLLRLQEIEPGEALEPALPADEAGKTSAPVAVPEADAQTEPATDARAVPEAASSAQVPANRLRFRW